MITDERVKQIIANIRAVADGNHFYHSGSGNGAEMICKSAELNAIVTAYERQRAALENVFPWLICQFHLLKEIQYANGLQIIPWKKMDSACQFCDTTQKLFDLLKDSEGFGFR